MNDGHSYSVLVSLLKSVDINATDKDGRTPLHFAVLSQNDMACRLLVCCENINVNPKDKFGKTPMFYAVVKDFQACAFELSHHPAVNMNELLDSKYSIGGITVSSKATLLHSVCHRNWKAQVIDQLFKTKNKHADFTAPDAYGFTPVDYCQSNELKTAILAATKLVSKTQIGYSWIKITNKV
jgi:ankyrin repeat protein